MENTAPSMDIPVVLFKVTIDGVEVEVAPGTTIILAARKIGPEVAPPAMCYYEPLKGTGGKCRACLLREI